MKYDLKKSKTTEAETIEHCLTVLYCLFQEHDDAHNSQDYKKSAKKWRDATGYLRSYIKELFKQQ